MECLICRTLKNTVRSYEKRDYIKQEVNKLCIKLYDIFMCDKDLLIH